MQNSANSKLSKFENSMIISLLLSIPILIMSISGLVLTLRFHPSQGTLLELWGISRNVWRDMHIYSAIIASLLLLYHLVLVRKRLYRVITSGRKNIRSIKTSRNLFWIFVIGSVTGFIPYIAGMFGMSLHHIIEIHDKLGLVIVILIILHIVYKWKSIITFSKKIFSK